ncbi:type I restriction endonuclease subunit M [Photobacterium indicum]|uniref:type I restriction endonuclease subunit M n=1 Tax=Photobacterium indicum TaxID=81447 RepID=UPI003D122E84
MSNENQAFQIPQHFELGQSIMTRGVADLFNHDSHLLVPFLMRHQCGNWGEVCEEDKQVNNEATHTNQRIISVYKFKGEKFWIITEWDRSVTTALLPSEY